MYCSCLTGLFHYKSLLVWETQIIHVLPIQCSQVSGLKYWLLEEHWGINSTGVV
jgi:hypothetical protein